MGNLIKICIKRRLGGERKLQKCKCILRVVVAEAARGDTWGKSWGHC